MRAQEIKFKNLAHNYSLFIGSNTLNLLSNNIKRLCPKTQKIALIIDKNVPLTFKKFLKKKLGNYSLLFLIINANEKTKSLKTVNFYLNKLLSKNFNRSYLVISIGGGIVGDIVGFTSSIYKRGINFINIPTTLLAQVDSAVGGKTGVNSKFGKNLIGSFYQPKLVLIDTSFLKSLPKKEMVCGYAEILKHSIIYDKKFFHWLEKNTKSIFLKKDKPLTYAIKKSCQIKMHFVNKDVDEKGLRMILNFGHTFAHAIEVKNNYSKKITHGEAVLAGMILVTRLSHIKKTCNLKTAKVIEEIYRKNNLSYTFANYSNHNSINSLLKYLKNDKKNDDKKINFILLKKIGKTTLPNMNKISTSELQKVSKTIAQY